MKTILRCSIGPVQRLLCLGVVLVACAIPAFAQKGERDVVGSWIWKSTVRKNKSQTQFRLVVRREGKLLKGTYSVDEFIKGVWQGEDGNQTAFVGHDKGNGVELEFDPEATQPGYEENVSYVAPSEGRKPSIAVITRNSGKLQWRLLSGRRIERIPTSLVLNREPIRHPTP